MIRAIWFYVTQVCARWRRVFLASDFLAAVAMGILVAFYGHSWMNSAPKVGDLANVLVAYTAIVLGFLVSSLAIAITHPSDSLVTTLARTSLPGREWTNAYSDLIFVFSWSAFVHWLQITLVFLIMFTVRSDDLLLPIQAPPGRVALVSMLTFLVTYCLLRFLISLVTIVQVGEVYIASLRRTNPPSKLEG